MRVLCSHFLSTFTVTLSAAVYEERSLEGKGDFSIGSPSINEMQGEKKEGGRCTEKIY